MRIRKLLFGAVAFLILIPSAAWTSGPVVVNEAGQPLVWDLTGGPVPFNPDQGALGRLDNAAATALVAGNFAIWEAVPTSNIAFTNAGALPVDVDATNILSFLGMCDGFSPVIYDTDGSIIAALLGPGAENFVLGFAGPECGSLVPPVITESVAVLNGRWIDGIDSVNNREIPLDDFSMVFLHEFGHSINLDHTQINLKQAFDGDPSNDTAIPTMFPVVINGVQQASLHRDDIASVSTLYPEPSFFAGTGTITGTILGIDGGTPFQGANVIARNVANPLEDAVSNVSGARYVDNPSTLDHPSSSLFGLYEIHNLTPGALYTIEIEQIDPDFIGGSSVGPVSTPFALPGPSEFWSGPDESNSSPPDDPAAPGTPITVQAGTPVTDINILMNDIFTESNEANDDFATATDTACSATRLTKLDPAGDVDFYRFTAAPGTRFTADVEACRLGSFDALLGLFDHAGTLLTFNDDFDGLCPQNNDRDPMIPFFPLPQSEGNVYYVAVTGFNPDFSFDRGVHGAAGPYKLNLSCEAPLSFIPRSTDSRKALYVGDVESRGVKALVDTDGDAAADAQNIFASGGALGLVNELDFDRGGRLLASQVFSAQLSLLPDVNRDFIADSVRAFWSPLGDSDAMRVQPGTGVVFLGDAGAALCCGFPGDIVTMRDTDGDSIPETSTTFATQLFSVVSLDFSPSGRLYVVDVVEGVIRACSDINQDFVADADPCPVFSNAVPGAVAIRVDSVGRVFAIDARTSRIRVLQDVDDDGVADGLPTTFARLPRGFVFDFGPSNGITFDHNGKLYVLARDQTLLKDTFSAFQDVLVFEDTDNNLVADGPPSTFARAVSREAAGLVFGQDPPPPLVPLSIKLRAARSGTVVPKTGVATVEGTVTCSRPAVVSILGRLEQKHARMTLKGSFSVSVPCDGETPWRVTVHPAPVPGWPNKRFEAGKAKVIAAASADDVATNQVVTRHLREEIKLLPVGKRR